jgi:mono/diheme cytochrome c family protein
MDALFWQRLHGGSTHWPIVLLPLSAVFDFVAWRAREEVLRRGFHAAGFAAAAAGTLGASAAVAAGLVMSQGQMLGSGAEKMHHLCVWPAFGLSLGLVAWRLVRRGHWSEWGLRVYLVAMSVVSMLIMGAAYWGGELLLQGKAAVASAPAAVSASSIALSGADAVAQGHDLFLMNCAHCHGDDAHGTEEAPDLTTLRKSDTRIASVVKNGIKGEMPRFDQKLSDDSVRLLTLFLHSVRKETH